MPPATAEVSLTSDESNTKARSSTGSPAMVMRNSPSRAALLRAHGDAEAPRTRSPSPARAYGAAGSAPPGAASALASVKALLGIGCVGPPSPATKAAACLAYGGVSVCITIFNKAVFSTHGFPYPAFVTLLQVREGRRAGSCPGRGRTMFLKLPGVAVAGRRS